MQTEDSYEVRVRVRSLAETSKVIQVLDAAGHRDVEKGRGREPFPLALMTANLAEAFQGRLNRIILRALYRLRSVDKEHGMEIDEIVEEMKKDTDIGEFLRHALEGVLTRTVAIVASAILSERHGWLIYDSEQVPPEILA